MFILILLKCLLIEEVQRLQSCVLLNFKILAHYRTYLHIGGTCWPENTLSAIQIGYKYGYKAVEFDVMLSKDNIPFLMHDDILGRTVRNTEYTGYSFSDILSTDIIQIDAGSWFGPTNPDLTTVRIPKFEDVIQYCIVQDIYMNIEIKPVPGYEKLTGEIVAELTMKYFPIDYNTHKLPLFSSFSYDALLAAQRVAPHIPRAYLIDNIHNVPDWKQRLYTLQAVALHTNHKQITKQLIDELKFPIQINDPTFLVFCYTVNSTEDADRLLDMGVDAFCTDKLDLFRSYI